MLWSLATSEQDSFGHLASFFVESSHLLHWYAHPKQAETSTKTSWSAVF